MVRVCVFADATWLEEVAAAATSPVQNREPWRALLGHKNICRLDVAMDHALGVCGIQGIGDLDSEREHGLDVQGLPVDPVFKRLAFQQLHGNEGAVTHFVDLIDGADVGVIESGSRFGFALEPAESLRSRATSSGRNLSATNRPSFRSSALYTTPIPPPPSFSTMR